MRQIHEKVAFLYFAVAIALLILLAFCLLAAALWELGRGIVAGDALGILDAAGLLIVGFAIVETAKFIAEEEILRNRELRSAVESRRSLTKFITIIVIAVSLEALVMIFEAGRTDVRLALYPAALFGVAMFALVALGLFQWLSSRIAAPEPDETSIDHRPAETEEGDV